MRKSNLYQCVTSHGTKIHSDHFLIFILRTDGPTRFGITVSKRVGGAVFRNRVKRLLRRFISLQFSDMPPNRDIVIIAKKSLSTVSDLNYRLVANELSNKLVNKDV